MPQIIEATSFGDTGAVSATGATACGKATTLVFATIIADLDLCCGTLEFEATGFPAEMPYGVVLLSDWPIEDGVTMADKGNISRLSEFPPEERHEKNGESSGSGREIVCNWKRS